MWHILCHVVFMHLIGAMMCIPSFWMICIYAIFAGSGRVIRHLTDLCDEGEVKSVYQLQVRGKKTECQCKKL